MKCYLAFAVLAALIPSMAAAQQNQAQEPRNQQPSQPQSQQQSANQQAQSKQPAPSLNNWSYDRLYENGWSARGLYRNTTVLGPYGDDIGSVENLIFSDQGKLLGVIAEIGGFIDIGDTHVFIPWDEVKISADFGRITVPVTENMADRYTFERSNLWRAYTNQITAVGSNVRTGPKIWKLSDILDDYTYLTDRSGYGYIHDLIVSPEGNVEAVVVSSDATFGGGYRAFPWRGYGWGYESPYYDLGYDRNQVSRVQLLDYDRIAGSLRPVGNWGGGAATGMGSGESGSAVDGGRSGQADDKTRQQNQQRPSTQQPGQPQR
ncbi:MAG: PRC-barrel domain-containing protein [Hyphomicrobiaceae bacterium]